MISASIVPPSRRLTRAAAREQSLFNNAIWTYRANVPTEAVLEQPRSLLFAGVVIQKDVEDVKSKKGVDMETISAETVRGMRLRRGFSIHQSTTI